MDFDICVRLCEPVEILKTDRAIYNALKRANINNIFEIYKFEQSKGLVKTLRGIGHKSFVTLSIDLQQAGYPSLLEFSESTKGRARL